MNVLVSACLLGVSCRYDGRSKGHPLAGELLKKHMAIPVCPEILGGLSTPRAPSERRAAATPNPSTTVCYPKTRPLSERRFLLRRHFKGAQPRLRLRRNLRRNVYTHGGGRVRRGGGAAG